MTGDLKARAVCLQTFGGRISVYEIISSFLVTSQSWRYLAVMSFSLADPNRAAGDGLRFVPHSRNDANTLRRRKMRFPVITGWQMPCLVFFVIATAREKPANPWSKTCQNTPQSWHKPDSVPNSSTTVRATVRGSRSLAFLSPPLLAVTCEKSFKTPPVLKSIYKRAKGGPNCCLVGFST